MKSLLTLTLATSLLVLAGCAESVENKEARIKEALAKLPPEDRAAAEAQRFCAVEEEKRLGSMGMPVKVIVEGQAVFLCCKGCNKKALAEPAETLARVKELKEKNKAVAPQ